MSDKEHPHFPDTTAAAVPTLRLCVKCGFCQPQSDESDTCFACAHPPTAVPQPAELDIPKAFLGWVTGNVERVDGKPIDKDVHNLMYYAFKAGAKAAATPPGSEKSDGGTD